MLRTAFLMFVYLVLSTFVYALPGAQAPQALINQISSRLRYGEAEKLVFVENADVRHVEAFTSQAENRHYSYLFTISHVTYAAIFFEGDWTTEQTALLESGNVNLVGWWDVYQGEPSFVTKLVLPSSAPENINTEASAASSEEKLLKIEDAAIDDLEKFVSKARKMHVRFTFTVPGYAEIYEGIVYEGDWNTDILDVLRSGQATLIGYWDSYEGEPFFVMLRVKQ